MSQEKKQVKEEKSNNKVWIVVLAVVLLAVNGIQGFFNYKQNDEIKQQVVVIEKGNLERDSLSKAITAKIEELKAENNNLKINNLILIKIIYDLKSTISNLALKTNSKYTIDEINNKLKQFEKLLNQL